MPAVTPLPEPMIINTLLLGHGALIPVQIPAIPTTDNPTLKFMASTP